MQVSDLCDAVWISRLTLIWQDHRDAATIRRGASPRDRPWKGEREYITKEQVRHVRYQQPISVHLLKKYEYRYRQRRQYESEDEEYEHRTGKSLKRRDDTRDH
jgi:hypothetical protein